MEFHLYIFLLHLCCIFVHKTSLCRGNIIHAKSVSVFFHLPEKKIQCFEGELPGRPFPLAVQESGFNLPTKKSALARAQTSPAWSPKNRSMKLEERFLGEQTLSKFWGLLPKW